MFNKNQSSNSLTGVPLCKIVPNLLSKPSGCCRLNIGFSHFLSQFCCKLHIQYILLYLDSGHIVHEQVFHLYELYKQDLWKQCKCLKYVLWVVLQHSSCHGGNVLVSSKSQVLSINSFTQENVSEILKQMPIKHVNYFLGGSFFCVYD